MRSIMLVDDVEISNFIMKRMLSKVSPTAVVLDYTSPAEALAVLYTASPDIIFLDLNMPLIDGWRFLEIMQENKLITPVYILTSSTSELDLQKSHNFRNVKDFIIKPIPAKTLQRLLDTL